MRCHCTDAIEEPLSVPQLAQNTFQRSDLQEPIFYYSEEYFRNIKNLFSIIKNISMERFH